MPKMYLGTNKLFTTIGERAYCTQLVAIKMQAAKGLNLGKFVRSLYFRLAEQPFCNDNNKLWLGAK